MEKTLYGKGIERASTAYITFENILIIATIFLGFIGMWSIQLYSIPLLSIFYASFILYMLMFSLRKHLCTQCYYYGKSCHCGWGKLASKLYKEKTGNQKLGGVLAAITWSALMLIPIIAIVAILIIKFTYLNLSILIAFILLVIINNIGSILILDR